MSAEQRSHTGKDPSFYLSQVRFHQSVKCTRTHSRVTFALGGDGWDPAVTQYYGQVGHEKSPTRVYSHKGQLLLYMLPSGCSRLLGMLLDGVCRASNVSILAIDRPGSGGTPMCPLQDRIAIATQQTQSVLEALQLDRVGQPQVGLISHSAGWFYALALLEAAPQYFARSDSPTRCVFSSPFIPTSLSSSTALSLLPKGLVALAPKVFPGVSRSLSWSTRLGEDILSVSRGLVSWKDAEMNPGLSQEQQKLEREKLKKKNREVRERSKQKCPKARFHPPYESHLKLALDAWKQPDLTSDDWPLHPKTNRRLKSGGDLLFDYFTEEGSIAGMTEDYLLCLGKAPNLDNQALTQKVLRGLERSFQASVSVSGKPAELVVLWGDADFIIPRKGRDYLDEVLKSPKFARNVTYQQWVMAEAGHDATLFSHDVIKEVLVFFQRDTLESV
ncbi:uncharacterized protein MEPE_00885 [Melanopsichium pennsylvanicum]|uniref:AB hydrolase-1 domain-containing protein n=2 Tax=Melanopsichium pennsylvanicum TaxID=63383 RepID=A0AAJ4XGN0_9BASI|nr:uncharacterized protein BN887_01393 [Melanopsichium pennsylvanicum 4]SNX82179.1 uncharacterized protein MEPE_00885 [Melanopsichium pennsylvanicum]